jgi:dTDP-4-amino-4,6-dideoxygalactose transaminase
LLLDPAINREVFRGSLRDAGVQTSVHYPPLHLTAGFARWSGNALPVTEEYARRTVTIPLFPHMSERQQTVVVEAIRRAAGGVG